MRRRRAGAGREPALGLDQPLAEVVERPFDGPQASAMAHGGEKADRSEDDGAERGEREQDQKTIHRRFPLRRAARRRRASIR